MAPETPPNRSRLHPFTLGTWLVDPKACQMSCDGSVLKLRAQLVDVLICLARRAGEIVLKDEILSEVWPGQFIAESGLSRCIAELRHVLHDDAQEPRYIETITKRGYRLVAPVTWIAPDDVVETPPQTAAPKDDRPETAQPSDAPIAVVAEAASNGRRLFGRRVTWAAIGGLVLAGGILALLSATRVPAKALTERDRVLLAFENRTGDAVFDDTIPLAVSIQLEQSPHFAFLPSARVQEALRMMKRPPETPITRAVGLEMCERVGGRVLIVTSIARLGAQYVLGLEAIECGSGATLARQQATAERKEQVLDALQRAAGKIRLAVGESAVSLQRYQLPSTEATTVSLDALRAVRRGDVAHERGQHEQALALYREAVTLDPGFALAHSRLGMTTFGDERVAALQKAYELRQHVTFPERLEIEVAYHRYVTGEKAPVLAALELLCRSYPRRAREHRDLSVEYMSSGRYDAALVEAREAVRLEPTSALNVATLARAHLLLDQVAEAKKAAEQAIAMGRTAADLHIVLFYAAVSSNDAALLARERAWAAQHPHPVASLMEAEAELSLNAGRLGEAIGYLTKYEQWAASTQAADQAHVSVARTRFVTAPGLPTTPRLRDLPARMRLRIARYEALCGLTARAVRRVETELRGDLGSVAKIDAVRVLVTAGRTDAAERLLDEIEARGPSGEWVATMSRTYRAAIAASRGQTDRALELLAPIQPFELGYAYSLEPLFERGRTHYLAGNWAGARAAFEAILAHPTIDSGRKLLPAARVWLARTLARAGDVAGSRRIYEDLLQRWRQADPDLPLLLEARLEYGALPK